MPAFPFASWTLAAPFPAKCVNCECLTLGVQSTMVRCTFNSGVVRLDLYCITVHTGLGDMEFGRFRHKGLQALHDDDDLQSVPSTMADKLRKLLFALETAESLDQVSRFPGWRLHPLKGELKGCWSVTVTGNWRLVFRYDAKTKTATDIDLVDYH